MVSVSLKQWRDNGWIVEATTTKEDIEHLLEIADRDIAAAQNEALPPEWQLNIAFNAVLQVATAALAANGYRVATKSHHYHAIESLRYTMRVSDDVVEQCQRFSKKRNVASYERAGMVTQTEANELISVAKSLRGDFVAMRRR